MIGEAILKDKAENSKMSRLVTVYDRHTGLAVAEYTLTPKEAIVACWEQHHAGNYKTWEYAKKIEAEVYPLERTEYGWTLGRFWVMDNGSRP